MLSYALAIAVATSSLVLFLTAFLMSDIHRKDDFLWSGVGLIYALVLWYCARNITGAVLLGQAAATALLVSYSWQTLKLRRAIANPDRAAEINNFSVLQKINGLLNRKRTKVQPTTPAATTVTPKVTEQEIAIPDTPAKDTVQTPASSTVDPKKEVSTPPVTDESATVKDLKTDKDTVEKLASGIVEPKKVSPPPVIDESATVKDLKTKPKISEAKSLDIEPGDRVSNVEPVLSQPAEEDTSTQDTEIITQPVKPKVVVQDKEIPSVDPAKNIEVTPVVDKPEAKTQELVDTATGDRPQVSDNEDIKPEPQTTQKKAPIKVEPVTKASALDSLETVEVAEVLEAAEDTTIDLDTDRSNIIEVTTTEINITTEVKKLEPPEDNSDFQE